MSTLNRVERARLALEGDTLCKVLALAALTQFESPRSQKSVPTSKVIALVNDIIGEHLKPEESLLLYFLSAAVLAEIEQAVSRKVKENKAYREDLDLKKLIVQTPGKSMFR